ncbi:unnamed protein product [Choristocarpus tenellus]
MDRSMAKEAGLTPKLKCVGMLTPGDHFAPDSLRSLASQERRAHTLREGSYRIRWP